MPNTITIPTTDPATLPGGPLLADDPRVDLAKGVATARAVVAAIEPSHLANSTPCDDYNVEQMAGHILAIMARVTAATKGEDVDAQPRVVDGIAADQWTTSFDQYDDTMLAEWADDAILERELVLPFATLPAPITAAVYSAELVTHAWDLARGLGIDVDWDEEHAAACLFGMHLGLPAEPRGGDVPFGPVQATADSASSADKLAAWMGRTVG